MFANKNNMLIFAMSIKTNAPGRFPDKDKEDMTREVFNKTAEARFSAIVGFNVECGMVNCKEGTFVSVIAEGNKVNELAVLPNIDGTIDYDDELNETFAYVKLS